MATSNVTPLTLRDTPSLLRLSVLADWCFVAHRAAVLELLCEEIEPQVEHFECVDHPDRLNRPDRCVLGYFLDHV